MSRLPPIRLGIIYGSTREGRLCEAVGGWVASEIGARGGFTTDVIDPLELKLPARHAREPGAEVRALRRRLAAADAFIVVTPEYNHGYPAALKQLIDSASAEWHAKPVGFVSYGGISGGLRAVEQLRLVFAELHAVGLRDTVSFAQAWDRFGADGTLSDPSGPRLALNTLLTRLSWWSQALADARQVQAYGAAA